MTFFNVLHGNWFHKWYKKFVSQSVIILDQTEKLIGTDICLFKLQNYENERNVKPNKKRGQKYVCTAQHISFDHPTEKAKTWYKSLNEIAEDDLESVEKK